MMKTLIATAAIFGIVGAAAAADLPRREPAPAYAPVGKAPIGKSPIGKAPVGKGPIYTKG
jgi:hypothetical protein